MIMAQNEYEKIVRAMADKGVPHYAFELLAELRSNEINNSTAVDAVQDSVCKALNQFTDYENLSVSCINYLQVIRKLIEDYKNALNEIAEIHLEMDGSMCFSITCGCEFCEQWRILNER